MLMAHGSLVESRKSMTTQRGPDAGAASGPAKPTVRYEGRAIPAGPGQRLLDAILAAGIEHRQICGGNGFCTSRRVDVLEGGESMWSGYALDRATLGQVAG